MHFVPLHGSLAQLYRYQVCNSIRILIMRSQRLVVALVELALGILRHQICTTPSNHGHMW